MKTLTQLEVRELFDEVSMVIIDSEIYSASINAYTDSVRIYWWDGKHNDIRISEKSNTSIVVEDHRMWVVDDEGREHTVILLVALDLED